jgi:hypothetical protein
VVGFPDFGRHCAEILGALKYGIALSRFFHTRKSPSRCSRCSTSRRNLFKWSGYVMQPARQASTARHQVVDATAKIAFHMAMAGR